MAYATTVELQAYLGGASLPADATRLLERASDIVDYVTFGNIDVTVPSQLAAAKKATCAQVEFWMTMGEYTDISSSSSTSISIGTFQQSSSDGSSSKSQKEGSTHNLAPRAMRILWLAGMVYRGVRMI